MILRIRYQQLGGHMHCRVFTAKSPELTFAKCGDLVFDEHEWPEVVVALSRDKRIQFLPDGESL